MPGLEWAASTGRTRWSPHRQASSVMWLCSSCQAAQSATHDLANSSRSFHTGQPGSMNDRKEDVIFERRADGIARELFIKGENRRPDHEIIQWAEDFPNTVGALLMRHEGVCFAVYGENVLIAILIRS